MKELVVVLLSVLLVCVSTECSSGECYRGAVVEMWPTPGHNQTDAGVVLASNLDQVKYWTKQASVNRAQIVVFPEDALYNFLFFETRDDILPYLSVIPEKGTQLCTSSLSSSSSKLPLDQNNVLETLGCTAIDNEIVLVIDIGEVVYCSNNEREGDNPCPSDGRFQYNIQVAVDEKGILIGHYRKYHLFPEDYVVFNQPILSADIEYFTTSFGVNFGQFICFDLFFRAPAWVLKDLGLQDFTFSTYWVNDGTIPPIPAVALQQGFSRAANTQLLASNIGLGKFDSGSGIYSLGEPLQEKYNPNPDRPDDFMLVADLPIQQQQQQQHLEEQKQQQQQKLVEQQLKQQLQQQQQHKRQQHGDDSSFPLGYALNVYPAPEPGHQLTGSNHFKETSCMFDVHVALDSPRNPLEYYALVTSNSTLFEGLLPVQMCNFYVCVGAAPDAPYGWGNCSEFPLTSSTIFENVTLTMKGVQEVGRPIPTAYASEGTLFSYEKGEIVFDYQENATQATVHIPGPSTLVSVGLISQHISMYSP